MRERPILFSAPMVRAILDGRKTQTRRIATKPVRHPDLGNLYTPGALVLEHEPQHVIERACPHGRPGDQLWVRETFFAYGRWATRFSPKKGRDEWHFIDMTSECDRAYQYAADNPDVPLSSGHRPTPGWFRRPAIHMPRQVSRILLEITDVRVERLQDISEADAEAEGARCADEATGREVLFPSAAKCGSYRLHFRDIFEQINGPCSWYAKPWVWVIEFKRVAS